MVDERSDERRSTIDDVAEEPDPVESDPEWRRAQLEAVRRAEQDAAAGRVYRTGRAGLEALLARFELAGVTTRNGQSDAADRVIEEAIADGLLRPAPED
ncbi:MAG: hypothetical protein M3442_01465 [Chloroflexota bacterium]|nr:hypothetical protein [Chloroflexota bacterium]